MRPPGSTRSGSSSLFRPIDPGFPRKPIVTSSGSARRARRSTASLESGIEPVARALAQSTAAAEDAPADGVNAGRAQRITRAARVEKADKTVKLVKPPKIAQTANAPKATKATKPVKAGKSAAAAKSFADKPHK